MLERTILAAYSLAVIAGLGGGLGYLGLRRWTDLRGPRFWAVVVVTALIFVLVFRPSGETLDETRSWLFPAGG